MKSLRDEVTDFVKKEVGREPMVIPMYVYITKSDEEQTNTKDLEVDVADTTIEAQGGDGEAA